MKIITEPNDVMEHVNWDAADVETKESLLRAVWLCPSNLSRMVGTPWGNLEETFKMLLRKEVSKWVKGGEPEREVGNTIKADARFFPRPGGAMGGGAEMGARAPDTITGSRPPCPRDGWHSTTPVVPSAGQGQGPGRMGGFNAAGPVGNCLCPKCGHYEPHERGVPCFERKCPQCGATMIRE